MSRLLPLDEALRRVLLRVKGRRRGRLPLADSLGLRLARAVRADRDQPPFDRATVDGYAVSSSDPAAGREPLAVVETVFAGTRPALPARRGCGSLVMTGAPLPRGADAVVKREDVGLLAEGGFVLLPDRPRAGEGVHRRGTDVLRGKVAVEAGTLITARVAAVLASVGASRPVVFLPPRVAVGVTGDELAPLAARRLGSAEIRNSNGPTLEAMVLAAGGVPISIGASADREADLLRLVRRGLRGPEVLVLSGGVSAGDRDLVPVVFRRAGVRKVFHKIDLKPGKPLWFGVRGRTLVFGLPGNPVSAQVTFSLLVAPALAALRGEPAPGPHLHPARLRGRAPREGGRTTYRPAFALRGRDGVLEVRLVPWNGSGDFVGFARSNALLLRRPGAPPSKDGADVEVLLLDGGAS